MFDLGRRGWPLLALLVCGTVLAQAPLQDPGEKSVKMVRTEVRPVIDGKLDDAIWATAAVVDDLHQTAPVEYATPPICRSTRSTSRIRPTDDGATRSRFTATAVPQNPAPTIAIVRFPVTPAEASGVTRRARRVCARRRCDGARRR